MFETEILSLPIELQESIRPFLTQLELNFNLSKQTLPDEIGQSIVKVCLCSDFVSQHCLQDSTLLTELIDSGDLLLAYSGVSDYLERLSNMSSELETVPQLMTRLRIFRRREMIRLAWRDLSNWSDITQILTELSFLAECCIRFALETLFQWLCVSDGIPVNHDNIPQSLIVVAMGKLGAYELNFSSDIDLIFFFEQQGQTQASNNGISNAEFFDKLGRQLIKVLDQVTSDGFVFRVDMRLRPFGEAGPLVINFNALQDYYQAHGREWERYAWVKARVLSGSKKAQDTLRQMLKPFIYRRYIDFGVFEALRDIKQLMSTEHKRKGSDNNIKLGLGGIREIEFIAQVFQLIRGGRESELQAAEIKTILPLLSSNGHLPEKVTKQLKTAYDFLRCVENRLQEVADQQTHDLPNENLAKIKIAYAMGFLTWQLFERELNRHRHYVQQQFEQVFFEPNSEHHETDSHNLKSVWLNQNDYSLSEQYLIQCGFENSQQVREILSTLSNSKLVRSLSEQATRRLDKLMPLLLIETGQAKNSDETLVRALRVIERILQRSVYLALLIENPSALSQFILLCSASPWVTAYLAKYPVLLDALIDPRILYALPNAEKLLTDLRFKLSRQDRSDLEQQMNTIRYFKQSNELQVAAADISQVIPLMQVSDYLSWIADAVIESAFELAWYELSKRHGEPENISGSHNNLRGFAIIAYGKLGGKEIGYGSDLDLVFLHTDVDAARLTTGQSPISLAEFYIRVGQAVIRFLSVATSSGRAYEIDMRLRPNGASGFLVSSISAFEDYQLSQAWTWEHQALVRARAVCGDSALIKQFNAVRYQVLARPRDILALRGQVKDMRNKMKQNFKPKSGCFDLKLGSGGIADIEFMVQYGVLAWAHQYPTQLLSYTDNIRVLEKFAEVGLVSESDKILLSDAYITFRQRLHQCRLQGKSGLIIDSEYCELRSAVSRIWQCWFEL